MPFATPDETEQAYYEAFARGDVDLMARVWLEDEHVSCIHPLAERISGYRLVIASWRAIFHAQGGVPIEFAAIHRHRGPVLAVHTGLELVTQPRRVSTLVTTNIYQLTEGGWRMLVHHASPAPAVTSDREDVVH